MAGQVSTSRNPAQSHDSASARGAGPPAGGTETVRQAGAAYVILIAFTAAIGGFLLGYDGSVISGAAPFYKSVFGLEDGSVLFGFSVSCLIWGCIFGNFFAGPVSDRIGRKSALLIAAVLFIASSLITALAGSIVVFIAGRIMAGVGVGFAILVAPVFIAEVAPPAKRGWLVSFNQLLIVVGLSSAYFVNYLILRLVENPLTNWRWMMGVEAFPSVIYLLLLLAIPESPRWLVMKNRPDEAKAIMVKVGGPEHAEREFLNIIRSLKLNLGVGSLAQAREIFSSRMRLILIIGVGLAVFQQVSGINSVLYYAPMIFESAGSGRNAAFVQAIAIGAVFLVVTIVSMLLIDRMGRKPLLYIGVSMMAVSLSITGWAFRGAAAVDRAAIESAGINPTLVLVSLLGFIAGFSLSLGPVMWAMFSEIFPNRIRGVAISFVGTLNSSTSFVVATLFPVQLSVFGSSATFFIYAGCMFLCLVFVWKYVVETKGRSLEELEAHLMR